MVTNYPNNDLLQDVRNAVFGLRIYRPSVVQLSQFRVIAMKNAPVPHLVLDTINRLLRRVKDRSASIADTTGIEAIEADTEQNDFREKNLFDHIRQSQLSLEPQIFVEGPRSCTPAQMADIILRTLNAIDGCPKQGFEVTVYGSCPWNAMLQITPAAKLAPAAAQLWRDRVRVLVPLLRDQYEIVDS